MFTVAVVLPPELVAVTVYVVAGESAVGVPEITPVVVSRLKPAGRDGLIEYEVTVPVTVGELEVIATVLA